jgi:hemerythrin
LGDGNLDMDEVDRRLKEIEEFFALEEGESLKDTLDELIELQKWIEEHLATFDETVANINKTIADEEDRAVAAE